MNEAGTNFSELANELGREPPRGAKERVLVAVLARGPRRQRPSRALVLVLVTLVTTTAAAVGVSAVPSIAEHFRALGAHFGVTHGASTLPTATPRTLRNTPAPHGTPVEEGPAGLGTPVPGPDLPAIPPIPEAAEPAATLPRVVPGAEPAATLPRVVHLAAAGSAATVAPGESLLAQQVAAYREATRLVAADPGLAVVRLRAFEQRFPHSALGEEASLRLVQAFAALGRDAEARAQAEAFVKRYPQSARRSEMEALAAGAKLKRTNE